MSTKPQPPQPPEPAAEPAPQAAQPRRAWRRHRLLVGVGFSLAAYLLLAYLCLPMFWSRYARKHPALTHMPDVTHLKNGLPGDPLNVALIGPESALHRGLLAAGWYPADPVTLETSLRIAADTLRRRPYDDAPVSALYLWNRKQDLAFEQPIGHDPRRRHHVRFWRASELDDQGLPLWIGAATLDTRVGLSHETKQITHHIGPDVDAERDRVLDSLKSAGWLGSIDWLDGFHSEPTGKNGGGDPYQTDQRLGIGRLSAPPSAPTP